MNVLIDLLSIIKNGSLTLNFSEPHKVVCSRICATPDESSGIVLNITMKTSSFELFFKCMCSELYSSSKYLSASNAGLKKEFGEQFQNLGLTQDSVKPDFKAVISLSVEKKNKRSIGRRNPYYYDPFYDDHLYDNDRSFLRLTLYDVETGDPLWTGLRSTNYIDSELKLTPEEISKYVNSFLSELVN